MFVARIRGFRVCFFDTPQNLNGVCVAGCMKEFSLVVDFTIFPQQQRYRAKIAGTRPSFNFRLELELHSSIMVGLRGA